MNFPKLLAFLLLAFGLLFTSQIQIANAGSCGYQRCWGAVGFGPYGARAFSHGYGSQNQAWNRVNSECQGNCSIIKTFYNTCGAIASGANNGWGWAYTPSINKAKRAALRTCRKNDRNCQLRAWACSK